MKSNRNKSGVVCVHEASIGIPEGEHRQRNRISRGALGVEPIDRGLGSTARGLGSRRALFLFDRRVCVGIDGWDRKFARLP